MNKVIEILGIISRVLLVIVLLCTVMLSIGTAYIVFAPDDMPKPFRLKYDLGDLPTATPIVVTPTVPVLHPGQGIIISTGTKIINLTGTGTIKYIRVTISLEFDPRDEKYIEAIGEEKTTYLTEFSAEVTTKMPMIDDVIITHISTKTFDSLYTAAGKESLRKELLTALSERVPEMHIISIYFTEFVIN